MTPAPRSSSTGVTIGVASASASLALVPAFLFGATGPFVRADLGFGAGVLGLVVSTYWMAMALTGTLGGRLVQGWGAASGLRAGVVLACVGLATVALAPSTPVLFVGIALGGVASAVITPATDLAVIQRVPERWLPIAFGIKQSSLPAASLLAGVGVPVLALTLGWRWTFVAVMLLALPALLLVRTSWNARPPVSGTALAGSPDSSAALRALRPLVLGMGLAMAAVSATGAFYVESALGKGIGAGTAGLLLAAGSGLGILGRFGFTWRLSSRPHPFGIVAALTALGAVGILGIAAAQSVTTLLLATLLAFGAGWGWNGLFTHAVVAAHRDAAARASGMLVAASATGGVLGPSSFGLVATTAGISVAWSLAAAEMLLASVLWVLATRPGRRSTTRESSGSVVLDAG